MRQEPLSVFSYYKLKKIDFFYLDNMGWITTKKLSNATVPLIYLLDGNSSSSYHDTGLRNHVGCQPAMCKISTHPSIYYML
jgi:hypothetical protein